MEVKPCQLLDLTAERAALNSEQTGRLVRTLRPQYQHFMLQQLHRHQAERRRRALEVYAAEAAVAVLAEQAVTALGTLAGF